MKVSLGPIVLAIVLLSTPGWSVPDEPKSQQLTAEDVLSRYLEAIGGRRLHQVKTIVSKWETTGDGGRQSATTYRKAPNLYANIATDENGLKSSAGFDGRTAWAVPPKPLKEGQQVVLDGLLDIAPIAVEFYIRPYKKVKLLGIKDVGDRKAYAVKLIQEGGEERTYFLDSTTFLLLRIDWSAKYSNSPERPWRKDIAGWSYLSRSTSHFADWREVSGVKVPFEIRSTQNRQGLDAHGETFHRGESITRVLEYQIDGPLDDAVFAPPPGSVQQTVK